MEKQYQSKTEVNHKDRLAQKCASYKKCGGCNYLDLSYEQQLRIKQGKMEKLLSGFGKLRPIIGMEKPEHYRCKVHHAFARDAKGMNHQGVYEAKSHRVVDVENCLLEDELSQKAIQAVFSLLKSFKIKIYDEDTQYGFLRHVLVRRGFFTGELMVVLVCADPIMPSKNNFVKALRKLCPEITTVVLNINDKRTSMVLGKRNITLYGPGYIKDTLCGLTFRISPDSFYQVNPAQTQILYDTAIEYAGLSGKETVIDAYCGVGTIGMCACKKAKSVIGVELNADAVRDARENAKANRIENIRFVCGDAGEFMCSMARNGERADVVLMDPPRSGSTNEFIDAIAVLAPKKVVYISCGPESLARDLSYFKKKGFRIDVIQPVDMFPYTEHVETVVLLSQLRQKPDDYIDVDVDVAELEGTSAETKATYEKIKKYVAEHNDGMKVSSLYISQVKRKCGLELAENFNLPKSENSRQPQCPKDKERAIMEALKTFQMI